MTKKTTKPTKKIKVLKPWKGWCHLALAQKRNQKLFRTIINKPNMPLFDKSTNRIIPKKDWSSLSFNIKPLSVAKFFYEKGIELNSTMQDLLYLSFIEVLKKEGYFLFTEEFQAWRAGPTLGSVFLRMHNYFQKNNTYQGLFDKYPTIDNEKLIKHLENVYQKYKKHEVQKKELTFAEKAKDRAWKITRKPLNNSSTSLYSSLFLWFFRK